MAILKIGSKGSEVKKLQVALNKNVKPSPKLKTDGAFGPNVDRAVRTFQKKNKLKVDGIVGPKTLAKLNPPKGGGGAAGKGGAPDSKGGARGRGGGNGGEDAVKMDVFDYRERKKKVEAVMKDYDDLTDGYAKAYDAIPALAANMVKQAKQSHAAFLKGNKGIDGMADKWYPISDKIIKLQDAFKAAEKKNDVARQRKIKSDVDKLHAEAEKFRTAMEKSLSGVESVRQNGYDEIVASAEKITKMMNW